ncbi:MAG: TRAP transporter small permease [Pseudolabrys sp.]|jgi:TRAP-type C4-dicarboxylate transport system permease small subunit
MSGGNSADRRKGDAVGAPLIVASDQEVVIEHYPEDWLAFALFWALAFIVFLQFYTRYILNDSLAWTEEIARYGLMWITFIGGGIVVRKQANIAVEVLLHFAPPHIARVLLAVVDIIKLGFIALLAYFSVTITDRMGMQTMTVIDWSMSYVYGGIAFGCFVMLARQIQCFWRNARDGWRRASETIGSGVVVD